MKNLKQKAGSKNCVAVVAAMAFNVPVEEFENFIGLKEEGYTDADFAKFGLEKGFFIGVPFAFPDPKEKDLVCKINMHDAPAYVVVVSENIPGERHAVYWDGQNIWDPNPTAPDLRPVEEYKIILWYPIVKLINK